MSCRLAIVDAFTDQPFAGNPAAVAVLDGPADAGWMQRVATEMNLSETAFLHPAGDGGWGLRWFTPRAEVPLCGHATLASAHVLWESGATTGSTLRFLTLGGDLLASRAAGRIWLDFPVVHPAPVAEQAGLRAALRVAAAPAGLASSGGVAGSIPNLLVELDSAAAVAALTPDMRIVRELDFGGVIVTARSGDDADRPDGSSGPDFVSRSFAPAFGIDEDPVTGSSHCLLAPYWAARLGRTTMTARQVSARGGDLWLELRGDRVLIGGHAITVARTELVDGAARQHP